MRTFTYNHNGQEVSMELKDGDTVVTTAYFPTLGAAKAFVEKDFAWHLGKIDLPGLTPEEVVAAKALLDQQVEP